MSTCTSKPAQIWNVLDPSNTKYRSRYLQYMRLGDVWSVKFPRRSQLISTAPDRFPGAGDGAGGDGFVRFYGAAWRDSQLAYAAPNSIEFAISYCPGDFDTAPAGYKDWNQKRYRQNIQIFVSSPFNIAYAKPGWDDKTVFTVGDKKFTIGGSFQDVIVDPDRDFYINFRYTKVNSELIDELYGMAFEFGFNRGVLPVVTGTGTSGTSGISGTSGTIQPGKDVDVTVSPCKGNFTIISPGSTQSTAKVTNFNGKTLSLKYSYDRDTPGFPLYLNPNNEHFVNFRWKKAEYDTRLGTGYFQAKFYYERVAGVGSDQPTCTDQPVSQYFIDQPVGAVGLKNDQVLSIQFPSTKLLDGVEHVTNFQFGFVLANPQATNHEYCISECRGSFVAVNNTNCKGNVSIPGTSIYNSIPNTIVPEYYGTTCVLEKNKNYYLNVRTKDPATGANTCSDPAGCGLSVSLLYYPPRYTPAGEQSTVMSSCASFSGRLLKWDGSQIKITPFTNSSTVAIEIDTEKYPLLNNSKSYAIGFVSTSDTTRYAEVEASISNCPGDFNAKETFGSRCGAHSFPPGSMRVSLGTSNQAYTVCELPVSTKKIYVNFRLIKTDGSGSGSCEVDSCPLWVNISR